MNAWLPNGKLSNGTLLMGPLKEKPKDGDVISIVIDDVQWFARFSGHLHPGLYPELEQWARQRIASYKKREESESNRTVGSALGGAILGASLGGPIGLVIGAATGAFLATEVNESNREKGIDE